MKKQQKRKSHQTTQKTLLILAGVIAALALCAVIVFRPGNTAKGAATGDTTATDYVEIAVEGYGVITAELYGGVAPVTVANFLQLADEGFYDGLTFHRIISGFMIQGGDPNGNGTGGSSTRIKGEFSANGVQNDIAHERGVLSMARSSAYDSASSQFFIMHADAPHLNGQYAAFGRVLSGIEVVDAICQDTPVQDSNGTVAAANQPVITYVKRIDKPEE